MTIGRSNSDLPSRIASWSKANIIAGVQATELRLFDRPACCLEDEQVVECLSRPMAEH
jgi:hypothetical protein